MKVGDTRVVFKVCSWTESFPLGIGKMALRLHSGDGVGSAFIGLGAEPAAQKFRKMLKEAVAQA